MLSIGQTKQTNKQTDRHAWKHGPFSHERTDNNCELPTTSRARVDKCSETETRSHVFNL